MSEPTLIAFVSRLISVCVNRFGSVFRLIRNVSMEYGIGECAPVATQSIFIDVNLLVMLHSASISLALNSAAYIVKA